MICHRSLPLFGGEVVLLSEPSVCHITRMAAIQSTRPIDDHIVADIVDFGDRVETRLEIEV